MFKRREYFVDNRTSLNAAEAKSKSENICCVRNQFPKTYTYTHTQKWLASSNYYCCKNESRERHATPLQQVVDCKWLSNTVASTCEVLKATMLDWCIYSVLIVILYIQGVHCSVRNRPAVLAVPDEYAEIFLHRRFCHSQVFYLHIQFIQKLIKVEHDFLSHEIGWYPDVTSWMRENFLFRDIKFAEWMDLKIIFEQFFDDFSCFY